MRLAVVQVLLVPADGAGVHDDTVLLVADAVLRATLRVHLEVGDAEAAVGQELDLAEAEGVAFAVGTGVIRVDREDLLVVLDADEDAVLTEAALAVLEGRVARQRHGGDVGVPGDGDLLEVARPLQNISAVLHGSLGGREHLVAVGGADVDLASVLVQDERLEIVILTLGLPAVVSDDGRVGGFTRLIVAPLSRLILPELEGAGAVTVEVAFLLPKSPTVIPFTIHSRKPNPGLGTV
jgi:hypothetical protein